VISAFLFSLVYFTDLVLSFYFLGFKVVWQEKKFLFVEVVL